MGNRDHCVQIAFPLEQRCSSAGATQPCAVLPGVRELSHTHEPSFWRRSHSASVGGTGDGLT